MKTDRNYIQNEAKLIAEARRRLAAWYAGDIDHDTELWLAEFFRNAVNLPDDLRVDAEMFMALAEASTTSVEMPAEHKKRITDAVEQEISGSHRKRRWTIVWYAAASLLLLLGAGLTIRFVYQHEPGEDTRILAQSTDNVDTESTHAVGSQLTLPTDTVARATTLAHDDSQQTRKTTKAKQKAVAASSVNRGKSDNSTSIENNTSYAAAYADNYTELTEEEKEMEARGYRVVSNPDEANAIVGLVLARVQENVVDVGFLMEDADYRYERVVSRPL